jgi:hypothetical protein
MSNRATLPKSVRFNTGDPDLPSTGDASALEEIPIDEIKNK